MQVVGEGRCPIVDTYWQTETGAHIISPLPGVWDQPPGAATLPFFGVQPVVLNEQVWSSAKASAPNACLHFLKAINAFRSSTVARGTVHVQIDIASPQRSAVSSILCTSN